jgi:hypothetical protein
VTARVEVSAGVAAEVVGFFGDTNVGVKPKPAVDAVLRAIRVALRDDSDEGVRVLAALMAQFPEHVAAVKYGDPVKGSSGFEWLRGVVKGDDQLPLADWAVRS